VVLTASRRPPGIRFERQPPILDDVLPRMDIAGFVGFAAWGPVDVPVAIEDAAEFARIFGPDAPLAWDEDRGEQVYAHLAPAVRAFFRNGGRRCWVVRVAGADAASDRFELPGVTGVVTDRAHRPAHRFVPAALRAASPGSWADGLTLSASVAACALRYEDADLDARRLTALAGRRDELVAGDLVRLRFAGEPWTLLIVVGSVAPAAATTPAPAGGAVRLDVRWTEAFWLRPGMLAAGAAGEVSYLGSDGDEVSVAATAVAASAGDDGAVRIALLERPSRPPRPGCTLHATFSGLRVAIEVGGIEASSAGEEISGRATAIQVARPGSVAAARPAGVAERLELDLRLTGPGRAPSIVTGLGFAPAHPRFAGALLDDARRLAPAGTGAEATSDVRSGGAVPLAGLEQPPSLYLPFAEAARAVDGLAALRPAGHARVRDGLERFDARLFVDADVAAASAGRLIEIADGVRDRGAQSRALRGIHALLDNDEITLVAVPDGIHRAWSQGAGAPARMPVAAPPRPAPDGARFHDCAEHTPAAPVLSLAGDAGDGAFTLTWTATDIGGASYELQESTQPELTPAQTIYSGPARMHEVRDRPAGFILYYRVRAVAGAAAGDWSDPLLVRTAPDVRWVLEPSPAYDAAPLVELQLALLRMCAARGDMLAVLALPGHYRAWGAVAHVWALDAASRGPGARAGIAGRDAILGYGALYHPWLHASEPERLAPLRLLPPDGAATGVIASRAWRRGAWVAPANEPVRDVVALAPRIPAGDRQALQDAQVNLVRQEPEGFLWLAADTLAGDEDVRSIGVRRLLQSLRRLALARGAAMAFEVNDDVTRRTLSRTFEAPLGRMFELGAFAGRTPGQGFRVDTPASAADLEQGILVVELRVAPAHPLTFVLVRLVSAGTGVRVEGR
jgi:hypothetical protein